MPKDQLKAGGILGLPDTTQMNADEILALAAQAFDLKNIDIAKKLLSRVFRLKVDHVQAWRLAYAHFAPPGQTFRDFLDRWLRVSLREKGMTVEEIERTIALVASSSGVETAYLLTSDISDTRPVKIIMEEAKQEEAVLHTQPNQADPQPIRVQSNALEVIDEPAIITGSDELLPRSLQPEDVSRADQARRRWENRTNVDQVEDELPESQLMSLGEVLGVVVLSILAGGYALATVAVANFLLIVVTFCFTLAGEIISSSTVFAIIVGIGFVGLVASVGSPFLIVIGIICAVAGGIAGLAVGIILGLGSMIVYYLTSFIRPVQKLFIYIFSIGCAVWLYHFISNNVELLQTFLVNPVFPFRWIHILNYILSGCLGLFVAITFTTGELPQSEEDEKSIEETNESMKKALSAPWKFYKRAANWSNDLHEQRKEEEARKALMELTNSRVDHEDYERAIKEIKRRRY